MKEQLPPHSHDIERAVLGAMLIDPDSIGITIEMLSDADFYKPEHAMIYRSLVKLYTDDSPVDQLTLGEQLKRDGNFEHIGGDLTLSGLIRDTVSSANIVYHCRVLKDKNLKRKIILTAQTITSKCYEDKDEAEILLMELENQTINAWDTREAKYTSVADEVFKVINTLEEVNARDNKLLGVNTGIPQLNKAMGGWRPGRLTILAGKTGEGKSALALEFAAQAARSGTPVVFFSLEMMADEITERLVQSVAPFDLSRVYEENLSGDDWNVISEGGSKVHGFQIYISDQSGISIAELTARAKRLKRERDIGLVIVDYLQLVAGNGYTREQEVASVSRGLKALAANVNIPVIALSQFSRRADQDTDEPKLSHLRESGAIEQDANTVLILFNRHETKEEGEFHDYGEGEYNQFIRELIVKKNRGGKKGAKIFLLWIPEYTRFGEVSFDMKLKIDRAVNCGTT